MTGPRSTPDADVTTVADPLPRVAGPATVASRFAKVRHAVEHRVHLRNDVLAVDDDRLAAWRAGAPRGDGAVLGHVDLVAGTRSMRSRSPDLLGEAEEERRVPRSRGASE